MANLSESSNWEAGIYQLETTDPVQGGASGIANQQAKQLANRTTWLKDQLDGGLGKRLFSEFEQIVFETATGVETLNLGIGRFGRYINLTYDASTTGSNINLPLFSGMTTIPDGSRFVLQNNPSLGGDDFPCTINASDGIFDRDAFTTTPITVIVLRAGEFVELIKGKDFAGNNRWILGDRYFKAERLPAGVVEAFAMNAPPAGWLAANGAAISRTTYARLFAAIGTTFGAGNGSTTFNLPDLRGEFIRGFDSGRGVDAGRVFGSAQSTSLVQSGTGGSGLPRNIALLYCIKF